MSGVGAVEYHERTKHTPAGVREGAVRLDFENKPVPYKLYRDRPTAALPADRRVPRVPALAAIALSRARPTDHLDASTDQSQGPDGRDADRCVVDRRTVTGLCHYAAGVTKRFGGEPLDADPRTLSRDRLLAVSRVRYHAAACTGKLYHVDCYLVCGDLPDLPAGVYHFEPLSGSLDVLREGDYRGVLAAAAGGDTAVGDAPISVVVTATWWRNAWKYRDRTFRHAFWDGGTVLANLVATGHGLDQRAAVLTGFADEAVAGLVGVDPASEAPVAVVPVGRGDPAPDPRPVDELDPETRPLSPDPVDYPLVREAWRAGTLPDGPAARSWRERAAACLDSPDSAGGERIALDPAGPGAAPDRPLDATIPRRGSCREYRRADVPFRIVSTALDRATRGVPMDVRSVDGPRLRFVVPYLIATGVADLPDGAYRLDADAGELECLREGTFRREAGHLALDQRLGADAAVSVYLLADVGAVTSAFGDRGYRAAQLEAGLTAGRLYLATYAHDDLGGTGLTFYDDEVAAFFAPSAAGRTPMFCYTLGRPA